MEVVKIGKVLKVHGVKGAIKVSYDPTLKDDFEKLASVVILNLPYFIVKKELTEPGFAILYLEEVDGRETAAKFAGKDLMALQKDISVDIISEGFEMLIGFQAFNKKENLGMITDILEMPQQTLAQIMYKNKEVLIPVVEDFILSFHKKKKEIIFDLPEGYLDIYLE
ncbi:MAG: ribosome maturation factor RimM [Chitinophagales bacterium]|nr:ribosome maturation factor RimM [Chitinophagales bacterium]